MNRADTFLLIIFTCSLFLCTIALFNHNNNWDFNNNNDPSFSSYKIKVTQFNDALRVNCFKNNQLIAQQHFYRKK